MDDEYKLTVFGADWCPACKTLEALLEENKVQFDYVDCDTEDGRVRSAGLTLQALPTSIIEYGGKIVRIIVGLGTVQDFTKYAGLVKTDN